MIDGDLADEKVAATLFEVGCDDATFGIIDGIGYGEFIREASTFADAVMERRFVRSSQSPGYELCTSNLMTSLR